MSQDINKKYLPSEETVRRLMDRAASDENMRRALENPRFVALKGEAPAPGLRAEMEQASAMAVPTATKAGEAAVGSGERRGVGPRWTPARKAVIAAAAALAPALLVYLLLARPAEQRAAEVGTPTGAAGGSAALGGAPAAGGSAAPVGSAAGAEVDAGADADAVGHVGADPVDAAGSGLPAVTVGAPAPVTLSQGASRGIPPAVPHPPVAPETPGSRVPSTAEPLQSAPPSAPPPHAPTAAGRAFGSKPPPGGGKPEF